jgi:hypothetical protein
MAMDSQALGNALEVVGQGLGNASNQYFQGQINAAKQAQEDGLKAMELKATQDQKSQEMAETHRHNVTDETTNATKAQGELVNQQTEAALHAKQIDSEAKLHKAEIGHFGAEESQGAAHLALDREHLDLDKNKASTEGKEGWQQKEAYDNVNEDLKDAEKSRDAAQKQLDAAGQFGDPDGKLKKSVDDANKSVSDLRTQRDKLLSGGGDSGMAPTSSPQTITHPNTGSSTTPKPGSASPPITATGRNGEKLMLQNGQWVPMQ